MAAIKQSDLGELLIATPPPILDFPEALTQVFHSGDFVVGAAGYISLCGDSPAEILGMVDQHGYNDAASGTHKTCVRIAMAHTIFKLSVHHDTAGNNKIEATDLFVNYGLVRNAAGKWVVDKNLTTTNARCKIVKFYDPIGTIAGQVGVVILAANRSIA
jgi:hypothetical protein